MTTAPNTDNYALGKGIIFFDEKDMATGLYKGERDLGNAPAFAFNIALEKLEHFSSRGGLKAKDKEIISQITPGVSFTLDELNLDNLAMLSLATTEIVTQTTIPITDEPHVAHVGKRIKLAYRGISLITVTGTGAKSATTYVNGPDYVIDDALKDDVIGRIYIPPTSSIVEGDSIEIDYTRAAVTYTKIKAFTKTQVEGRLRFVSDNPVGGQSELVVWRVSLTPSGDTSLIGDDWSTLGFSGEVLKDATGHPDSPYMEFIVAS